MRAQGRLFRLSRVAQSDAHSIRTHIPSTHHAIQHPRPLPTPSSTRTTHVAPAPSAAYIPAAPPRRPAPLPHTVQHPRPTSSGASATSRPRSHRAPAPSVTRSPLRASRQPTSALPAWAHRPLPLRFVKRSSTAKAPGNHEPYTKGTFRSRLAGGSPPTFTKPRARPSRHARKETHVRHEEDLCRKRPGRHSPHDPELRAGERPRRAAAEDPARRGHAGPPRLPRRAAGIVPSGHRQPRQQLDGASEKPVDRRGRRRAPEGDRELPRERQPAGPAPPGRGGSQVRLQRALGHARRPDERLQPALHGLLGGRVWRPAQPLVRGAGLHRRAGQGTGRVLLPVQRRRAARAQARPRPSLREARRLRVHRVHERHAHRRRASPRTCCA